MTQNYVSSAGLPSVLAFLKTGRADLVSGCAQVDRADLHDRFVRALREQRPQVSPSALFWMLLFVFLLCIKYWRVSLGPSHSCTALQELGHRY